MRRLPVHQDDRAPACAAAFDRSVVERFGAAGQADADVRDPVLRGAMLAEVQGTLGHDAAELARADEAHPRGDPR